MSSIGPWLIEGAGGRLIMGLRDACCGVFLLAIVAPPEPGLEIGVSGGGGQYRNIGCTSPDYLYREQTYAANVRYRTDSGATIAANASESRGDPIDGGPRRDAFTVASRVGWHFAYGGAEAGVAAYRREGKTDAIPSGLAWIGLPEVHAFGTLLADRYAVNEGDLKVGLGTTGAWGALEVGVGTQGFSADLEVRPWKYVAPTLSVRANGHDNWNIAGGLTFRVPP